jgi:methyl-accepting chemotaxis protein
VADAPKARRLNVLQRMTLGYWALVLPIVVAAVLVVTTVALVKVRYVARETRLLDANHACVDVRYDLIRQENRLGVFKASGVSKSLDLTILQQAQATLAAEVKHLDSAIAAAGVLTGYDAFKTAWADFDSAVAGGLALAGQARPGFEGQQIPPNVVTTASTAIDAVATVYDSSQEEYKRTDSQMWKFVYSTTGVALVILVVSALIGMLTAITLPRRVARQLRSLIGALGATTAQMLGVVSQVASTADEVRQTSLLASQKATEVADDAQRAEEVVEAGRHAVGETLDGMGRIQKEMSVVSESVMRMSEQSESVSAIMGTVNSMAEQSSLLSVNAAIEASSAGEYGKGFAVVADEIRNLAVGSKQGVGQVRSIMTDVEKATSAAVMATEQSARAVEHGVQQARASSTAIDQLAESVSVAAQSAAQIVASAQQQLVGMDQIASAMASIDEAGAQNARGAQELETSVRHVETMAVDLADMVSSINPLAALRRRRAASPSSGAPHETAVDQTLAPDSTSDCEELGRE